MRAAVLHAAKDLRIDEVSERPLGDDEVRVRFGSGGICGSDLSYYFKGRVGDFDVRQPLILGHEVSGTVEALGASVSGLAIGARVAVNPSRACLTCDYCRAGRGNLCRNMRFFGSAAIYPHVQGGFSETLIARADQCVPVPEHVSMRVAACAEPLAVAVHACRRGGELAGRRVLIAGAGPIGILLALVARRMGAAFIAITDLVEPPLAVARAAGVDETICVATAPEQLERYEADKGYFDVALEATGSPQALASLFKVVRPGGRVVQVGMMPPGVIPVPANILMAREIDFVGAFRFHGEFQTAVDYLVSGLIDVTPILSAEMPMAQADDAFVLAADRNRAIKVHLTF